MPQCFARETFLCNYLKTNDLKNPETEGLTYPAVFVRSAQQGNLKIGRPFL
jgi:hypothetical protein